MVTQKSWSYLVFAIHWNSIFWKTDKFLFYMDTEFVFKRSRFIPGWNIRKKNGVPFSGNSRSSWLPTEKQTAPKSRKGRVTFKFYLAKQQYHVCEHCAISLFPNQISFTLRNTWSLRSKCCGEANFEVLSN